MVFAKQRLFIFNRMENIIMMKELNNQDPQEWLKIDGSGRGFIRTIRKGLFESALIINRNQDSFIVAEILESGLRGKTMTFRNGTAGIIDYQIIGEKEDHCVALTFDRFISVHSFDLQELKYKAISVIQIESLAGRYEEGCSLAVNSEHSIIVVHLMDSKKASRVLAYKLEGENLLLKGQVDCYSESIDVFVAMSLARVVEHHILFTAMSLSAPKSVVVTFGFNMKKNSFKELKKMRTETTAKKPCKVCRVGDVLYGFDEDCDIIRISYTDEFVIKYY